MPKTIEKFTDEEIAQRNTISTKEVLTVVIVIGAVAVAAIVNLYGCDVNPREVAGGAGIG